MTVAKATTATTTPADDSACHNNKDNEEEDNHAPNNNIINNNAADNNTGAVNVANGTQDHDAGGKAVALTIANNAPNDNKTHEAHVDTPFERYDDAAEAS